MKQLFLFLFITTSLFANAQDVALNQYKYIIVNNQYEFQNEANEYSFNELVVFELKKHNFTAFRNSEILPADMNRGECNALQLKVDKSGTLRVNIVLELVDCTGAVVFTSKKGVGTTKSNDRAYFEALRDAMTSFDEVDYKYTPKVVVDEQVANEEKIGIQQPAEVTTIAGKVPEFDEQVKDRQVIDAAAVAMQSQVTRLKKDYATTDNSFSLRSSTEGYTIFRGDMIIGTLKKSKGGCYLAVTTNFIGVGYKTAGGFSIEHTTDGKDQVMEFVKG
jgi:hypothetical protein